MEITVEQLQQQRRYEVSRLAYFVALTECLPCEVSIVFEDQDGRTKIIDFNLNKAAEAQIILGQFAVSMAQHHKKRISDIDLTLQRFATQD